MAFNAAADLGNNGGSTSSLTASYTCSSGAGRLLIVMIAGDSAGGADNITGVTYATVAMTQLGKVVGQASQDRNAYVYYLIGPATGANNVVVSAGTNHYLLVGAADYTGVNASGQPDASTTHNASGTSLTTSITTVTNNDWVVLGEESSGGTISAGTGTIKRTQDGSFTTWGLFDSNGAVTPAGSYSMTTNDSPSTLIVHILGAFAPSGGAFVNRPGPGPMGPSLPMGLAIAGAKLLERNPIMRRRELFRWVNRGESNGKYQDGSFWERGQ